MGRALAIAAAALALLAAGFLVWAAPVAGARLNRVEPAAAGPEARPLARELHAALRIADLHGDPLLWDRDLLEPGRSGHADVPRLQAGNVALQVFSVVTQVPRERDGAHSAEDLDAITPLAVASRWPPRTWASRLARALHQAGKLERAAAASAGALELVRTGAGLRAALERRAASPPGHRPVIALLSAEGLQALDGRLENLDVLFARGFRAAGLVHEFDNDLAGASQGRVRGGLTPLGRAALRRMEELRMVVDLAHLSDRALEEALAEARRPPWVSHAGVQAVCPGPRSLSDAQLRAVAARGGLVGVGFWREAACDISPRGIARAVRHAVRVAGPDHVALGSDWDGAVTLAFDAAGLVRLTQALLDENLGEAEVRKVMGENAIRFLSDALP